MTNKEYDILTAHQIVHSCTSVQSILLFELCKSYYNKHLWQLTEWPAIYIIKVLKQTEFSNAKKINQYFYVFYVLKLESDNQFSQDRLLYIQYANKNYAHSSLIKFILPLLKQQVDQQMVVVSLKKRCSYVDDLEPYFNSLCSRLPLDFQHILHCQMNALTMLQIYQLLSCNYRLYNIQFIKIFKAYFILKLHVNVTSWTTLVCIASLCNTSIWQLYSKFQLSVILLLAERQVVSVCGLGCNKTSLNQFPKQFFI
ncbi:unnamed protein product (macronuclear) [Paramecium tetraurelia]|uniref:Uncharacterized protein n=1 Tax=Paramecium tetraurelia TaxID=5888 RepID=A0BKV0_PARTE|nr:uncharacterized protein GSPATT00029798001 [Paramecium tetraurelia]CAK59167.1 unnamed protein product [Paramecium tetraurelia]|eukprot:XP_001426565.1 hypothetical protein (macronuclear) [Paramecium tetraurelia strain d4-2]